MACQKVIKQGRDDIKVMVNIQSPIPASVERCRDSALYIDQHNSYSFHKGGYGEWLALHQVNIDTQRRRMGV